MNTSFFVTTIFSWGTFFSHLVFLFLLFCVLVRNPFTEKVVFWISKRVIAISLVIVLGGIVGSLIYSEVVGLPPCVLCWIQRAFLFPQILLLAFAFWKKQTKILLFTLILSLLGGVVALYHSFTQLGGYSFTECTAVGGSCAKVFVLEFGYITIPMMALTVFAFIIVVYVAHYKARLWQNNQ